MLEEQTAIEETQAALNSPAPPTPQVRKLFKNSVDYFVSMSDDDKLAILQDSQFDIVEFSEAVNEHRAAALADIDTAIQTIKNARPKSTAKKSALLRHRYLVEVKQLFEAGIKPKEIVTYLKEKHRYIVKELAVRNLIADIKTEEMLESSELCQEIERHEDWTNQQLAHHLNGKYKTRTTAAVVKRVRAELEKKVKQ